MKWSSSVLAVLSVNTLLPSLVVGDGEPECYTDVGMITQKELGMAMGAKQAGQPVTSIPPRTYHLCPNTVFEIGTTGLSPPTSVDSSVTGGSLPLSTPIPGMTVLCGEDGARSNNCTLSGGFHHFVGPSNMLVDQLGLTALAPFNNTNMLIQGLTFTGSSSASVNMRHVGKNITFLDCLFIENTSLETCPAIMDVSNELEVTVDSCEFVGNVVSSRIIGVFDAARVHVKNTIFRDNVVLNDPDAQDAGKVIWFGETLLFNDDTTTPTNPAGIIENSCFYDNKVNNTVLVFDDVADVTFSNNYHGEENEPEAEIICPDIAYASVQEGRALQFSCVDFDAINCALVQDSTMSSESVSLDSESLDSVDDSAAASTITSRSLCTIALLFALVGFM